MSDTTEMSSSAEEEQTAIRGAEEEKDNPCDKDSLAKQEEEERSISAPLVLSQERLEEVYRKLHSLQEKVKKLQVRRDERREDNRDNKR